MLEGAGVFLLAGAELASARWAMLIAPDGVPHGVRNTGAVRRAALAVLSPGDLQR